MTGIAARRFGLLLALFIAGLVDGGTRARSVDDSVGLHTDKIHLKNGDVITGNMKELDRGKLRVKTLTMDTVYINWVDIESIETDKHLRIAKTDGTFNYGPIRQSALDEYLVVQDQGEDIEVPLLAVATIQPIRVRESIWHRIEGDASAGVDYKKSSDLLLINVASNLRFREDKYELGFSANWRETTRTQENNSSLAELGGSYTRFLKRRWFWQGLGALERNQELGIDFRVLAGGSAGRYFVQKPTLRFEVNTGVAGNRENRQDGTTITSAEGMIRSSLDIFKLNIPMTRLSANVNIFPGITESGRLRINTNINLRNEIIRDLFWDLTFYSTFDNQPAEGAEREDFGIVTSIGASF